MRNIPEAAVEPQTDIPPSAEVRAETDRRRAFRFHDWAAAVRKLTTATLRADLHRGKRSLQAGQEVAISQTVKLVATALADHANTKTGQCNPGHELIAKEIGATRVSTVSCAIKLLEAIGALKVSHGRDNRVSYELLLDSTPGATPVLRRGATPTVNYEGEQRTSGSPSRSVEVARAPEPPTATTTDDDSQDVGCPYLARELAEEPWNDLAPQNAQFLLNEDTMDLLHSYDEIAEEATGRAQTRRPRDTARAQALLRHRFGNEEFSDEFIARMRWAWTDPFSKKVVVHGMPTIEQYDGIGRGYDAVLKTTCEITGCTEQVIVTEQNKDWVLCPDCRAQFGSELAA